MTHIDILTEHDHDRLENLARQLDFSKDINYLLRCLDSSSDRKILVARVPHDGGLCVLNFRPAYPLFQRLNIPEIQDLNVQADHRRGGIGAALVHAAEDLARAMGATHMGIGVGLTASYGPAQRLYTALGYRPDGLGVSVDGVPIRPGEMRMMDDAMCLYFVKDL